MYGWATYLLLGLADEALFKPALALLVVVFSANGYATRARAGVLCSRLAMLVRVEMSRTAPCRCTALCSAHNGGAGVV
jgi:hypothetical protein